MPRPRLRHALFFAALSLPPLSLGAQTAPTQAAPASPRAANLIGTVTAVNSGTITIHREGANAGDLSVALTPQTRLLRTVPGETSLKSAVPMQVSDLAVGDRVLVRPTGDGDAEHPTAAILVAMKQGDIAEKHTKESEDWQRRGVAGIVAAVDEGSGSVTLRPSTGVPPLVIHTAAATAIRRYAPDSTSFADTHKATLTDIHPGDQLRARGQRDPGTSSVAAEEVVAGSFRNIAGTVLSIDSGANTVSLTDLATKKPLTLRLESSTQLRKLPPELAARLVRRSGGSSGAARQAAEPQAAANAGPGAGGGRAHSDTADLLERAPSITLADLKKGDAVMIVASGPGASQPTAITLISGVEPLLQASPEASAGLFSASWNLGSGGEAGGGEPQH